MYTASRQMSNNACPACVCVCVGLSSEKTNKQVNLKRKNGNITLVALLDIVIKPSSCFDRPIDDHTDSLQLSSATYIY